MANSAIKSESSLSLSSSVKPSDDLSRGVPKDWKFWCIISSLLLSIFQTAVLFVGRLSTPLPGKRSDESFEFTDM